MARGKPERCWGCGAIVNPSSKAHHGSRGWCHKCRQDGTREAYYAGLEKVAPGFSDARVQSTGGGSTWRRSAARGEDSRQESSA